jgi:hypothetical protein
MQARIFNQRRASLMVLELVKTRGVQTNPRLIPLRTLMRSEVRYALHMFERGLNTYQIAAQLRTSEAEVYNRLSRYREEIRARVAR